MDAKAWIRRTAFGESPPVLFVADVTESLILAQDERWRRASYMQVERAFRKGSERQTGE